jgi:glutamate racemase
MATGDNRPIGVFDSGIGGLTILRELLREFPDERFLYFSDEANCPYGPRPENEVRDLALDVSRWLVERDVKTIVVACNTASVSAKDLLRATFPDVPIIVTVPAVKPAAKITKSGKVILLATARAINDRFTHTLIDTFANDVNVISVACPGMVEAVEYGEFSGPRVEGIINGYTRPALDAGADVIVLGCTHFPALRKAVEAVAGPDVAVIDSGAAIARRVRAVLTASNQLAAPRPPSVPQLDMWTSGDPQHFATIGSLVLEHQITARQASAQRIGVTAAEEG